MIELAERPASSLDDLTGVAPILVLAPHPDDESLGCGALLAAAFAGPGAHVVCMTDGGASHPGSTDWSRARLAALRAQELVAAVTELGGSARDVTFLGYPDGGLHRCAQDFDRIAADLVALAGRLGVRVMAAPSGHDPHCDHEATAEIARRTARRAGLRHLVYPVWSRWHGGVVAEGTPHRFDTVPHRDRKARAIACHRSQLGQVVRDDPEGFTMPPDFVALFRDGDEIFHEAPAP